MVTGQSFVKTLCLQHFSLYRSGPQMSPIPGPPSPPPPTKTHLRIYISSVKLKGNQPHCPSPTRSPSHQPSTVLRYTLITSPLWRSNWSSSWAVYSCLTCTWGRSGGKGRGKERRKDVEVKRLQLPVTKLGACGFGSYLSSQAIGIQGRSRKKIEGGSGNPFKICTTLKKLICKGRPGGGGGGGGGGPPRPPPPPSFRQPQGKNRKLLNQVPNLYLQHYSCYVTDSYMCLFIFSTWYAVDHLKQTTTWMCGKSWPIALESLLTP